MSTALHVANMARGRCQKVLPWGANLPQTFAAKTEALFGHFWARKTSAPCSSRQIFLTIPANLSGKVTFLGDDRSHNGVGIVFCGPFVKGCGALPEAVPWAIFCLFEAKRQIFLAKRQTFLAKHNRASRLNQSKGTSTAMAIPKRAELLGSGTDPVTKVVAPVMLTSGSHPGGLVPGTFWQIPDIITSIGAGVEMGPSSTSAFAPVNPKLRTSLKLAVSSENSATS